MPFVVWRNPDGLIYTGWEVILFAWPVWTTSGLLAASCGFWLGTTEVERKAVAKAEAARTAEALARHDAAEAMERATLALSHQYDELKKELQHTKNLQADALTAIARHDQLQAEILSLKSQLAYSQKRLTNLQKSASTKRKKSSSSFLPFK